MFQVGDYVVGKEESASHYGFTTKYAYMKVIEVFRDDKIDVQILCHTTYNKQVEASYTVNPEYFDYAPTLTEWLNTYPDAYIIGDRNRYFGTDYQNYLERRGSETTVVASNLKMIKNEYNIPQTQLDYYANEIMELLPKFRFEEDKHYKPTKVGVAKLLDEYNKNKGWMYPYFMSHPNYIGNGKIAFSSNYHRKVYPQGVKSFLDWMYERVIEHYRNNYQLKICGMSFKEISNAIANLDYIYNHMTDLEYRSIGQARCKIKVNGMTTDEILAERKRLREIKDDFSRKGEYYEGSYFSDKRGKELKGVIHFINDMYENTITMLVTDDKVKLSTINNFLHPLGVTAAPKQKYSRLIGKICRKIGIDKHSDYDVKYAKLGDDINELDIKRHTVISINPIDYLTMSFGSSWSSCHTIDKMNDRNCPNSYRGMYCGGTLSYLLDNCTIIYYTIDSRYDGTDFEFQPKVNRCVFNLGEDKLIQGRVYPQANDSDETIYDEIRAIMQKTVSEMFNFNNYWILKKGTNECRNVTESYGAHYRDYLHYGNCNVSFIKPEEGKQKNPVKIKVGHEGICITCGTPITVSDNIICPTCERQRVVCPHCGQAVKEEELITVDGQQYCPHCAFFCDYHQRWEFGVHKNKIVTGIEQGDFGYNKTEVAVCDEGLSVNIDSRRYRRAVDLYGRTYVDTEVHTKGIISGEDKYFAFPQSLIDNSNYKLANNGKYYLTGNLKYDRHIKQYVPRSEWNYSLNCWTGIEANVREHNAMLERRAERRAARQARRATESVA